MKRGSFQKYTCEFIGTFCLVFFAAGAVMLNSIIPGIGVIGSGIISGSIITIVVFTFGQISGAHVNPALSLAAAWLGKLDWRLVPGYVISQMAGSVAAAFSLLWLIGDYGSMGANLPNEALGVTSEIALVIEIFLSFLLMWVICGTAYHSKGNMELAAIPIGVTVGIEVMLMGPYAGAAMNPARAFGPYLALGDLTHYWIYVVGPIAGMFLGAWVYRLTHDEQNLA